MSRDPELERVAGTLKQIPFPSRLAVELCADCNLNCTMCHHDQMQRPKGVMPFELWKKCAQEVADIAPQTDVWFSFCGEPLLEPDLLVKMITYGKKVGLESINLNSNGMQLTHSLSSRLVDSGLKSIVIGIDGFKKGTYEKIRVGGVHEVLYEQVEHLLILRAARNKDLEIMVQFIEMDENAGELDAFRRHWLSRGAVVKARKKLSWGGRFDTPLTTPFEDRIPCPWSVTMMHVFWDGRVPRCPGDTEGDESAGNAWHASLKSLWDELGPYREHHLQHRFAELPERCQSCKDWMVGIADRIRPENGKNTGRSLS